MSIQISKRFSNGLKKYDISLDNLKENWKYCGGEKGRHLNYYNLCCKGEDIPEHEERCICGHRIKENCYITDGDYILTLGNCCVKRFLPNSSRTCERCGKAHRNRKDNLCLCCRKCFFRTEDKFVLSFD
jgi:uracil-DNA glycosylase